MLSVSRIEHRFSDSKKILDGFSMSVSKGEIVALLGPSGCGKSTLLRLIAGLIALQQGEVRLAEDCSFSFVFQDPSLMPWANVFENVSLPQKVKGRVSGAQIYKTLEALEIKDLGCRYPAQLSGGQKMRVSIARALAANPQLLLLDEPFAALDEILRFKMNDLILQLRNTHNLTTIFVTHSIFEAAYLADRVFVMKDGKIAGSVTPGLDRNTNAKDQRSSAAFMIASRQISEMLSEDGV